MQKVRTKYDSEFKRSAPAFVKKEGRNALSYVPVEFMIPSIFLVGYIMSFVIGTSNGTYVGNLFVAAGIADSNAIRYDSRWILPASTRGDYDCIDIFLILAKLKKIYGKYYAGISFK